MQQLVRTPDLKKQLACEIAVEVATLLARGAANQLAQTTAGITLEAFFRRYIETFAIPHCSSWRDMERTFKNYFKRFSDLDMHQIRRDEVQAWHAEIGEINGHTAANRALELMVMLYNKAQEWDLIALYNPGTKIKKFRLQPRERFLQPDELPRFFAALETLRYETTRDVFLMCLFTGARVGNVKAMKWSELDFKLRTWRIPKTKNGDSQIIPLTTEAFSVVERRKATAKTIWVFNNKTDTDHIKYIDLAWRKVIRRAGIDDLRIHDLRRSLASWQAITGASTATIAATLNHKSLTSTQVYARLNTSAVRKATKKATQAMLEYAGVFVQDEPGEECQPTKSAAVLTGQQEEPWLTEKQIVEATGIDPAMLRNWRARNIGPPYLKQGYSVLYRSSSVEKWLAIRL